MRNIGTEKCVTTESISLHRITAHHLSWWFPISSHNLLLHAPSYAFARTCHHQGTNEIDAEFTEDQTTPGPDVETDNETVALAALSELISKMWTVARQLEFRKQDLEEKVAFLEEEKRRAEEEAAEAAAAAAEEGA